jgi:hypothetical protein
MKQLEALDGSTPEFDAAIGRSGILLADHVQDEETMQFPQLRLQLPQDEVGAANRQSGDSEEARSHPDASGPAQQRTVPSSQAPEWAWWTGCGTG